jgi:hypothetical protein
MMMGLLSYQIFILIYELWAIDPQKIHLNQTFLVQYINLLNSIIVKSVSLYSLLVFYIICVCEQSYCWNAPWFDFAT